MHLSRVTAHAAWIATASILLSACGGGGGGGGTPPTPTPTPSQGVLEGCNGQSSTTGSAIGNAAPAGLVRVGDNTYARSVQHNTDAFVPGEIAVTTRDNARISTQSVATQFKDATVDRELHFGALGKTTTVLHTTPGNEDALIASMRSAAGVESASRVSYRFRQAAPNDPYYPMQWSTKTNSWLGQWDMHFIRLAEALGVSTGSGVPVAIVDTGVDVSHPDLAGKIALTKCFVTGAVNSTGTDVSDLDGHGTNVAGIAASDTNNGFGFASVGDAASIMAYKVFPNPPTPAGCPPGSSNPACGASSTDIAAAVNDAVANGAKVINLSLGGGTCTGGVDNDSTEQNAIANALAHNVVVVAASGNSGGTSVIAPGCINNVIAVGATSLNDTGATQAFNSPQQYVASYSNYDPNNASWGIVAPGGDPLKCESATSNPCSTDYQHWIEHIYSSQVPGTSCSTDIAGVADCRILIAGTSQATPHVTGAVALMIGVNAALTPVTVKSILCSTHDPVPGTMLPGNGTTKPAIAAGCGALDVFRAVTKAKTGTDPGGTGNIGT